MYNSIPSFVIILSHYRFIALMAYNKVTVNTLDLVHLNILRRLLQNIPSMQLAENAFAQIADDRKSPTNPQFIHTLGNF
jgi:hypothetical protein